MKDIYLILSFVLGAAAGFLAAWFFVKTRMKAILEKTRAQSDMQIAVLEEKLESKENDFAEIKNRFSDSETRLQKQNEITNDLNIVKAGLEEKASRIPALEKEISVAKERIKELEKSLSEQKADIAQLETLNAQQLKQAQEKIDLLTEARQQLTTEFQNLANRIFEEKGKVFADQNKNNLDGVLNPLREQIDVFKKKVDDVYDKETRDRVSLFEEIKNLKNLNQQISKEAVNLANALKGDSKVQGNWGEVVLERVLEESGLQKGREYEIQTSLQDEKGKRFQPDVIVRLPEGKDVIIDSKVSLKAYERYFSAKADEDSAQAFKEHIGSMRNHIKELSSKKYEDLEGVRSLDFVLMFVPIEAAFLAAIQQDRELFAQAFEKNIMVVSPSTLLVTLRTIQNIWRYEDQTQNSREIAKKAGDLYDKFFRFIEALEDVGKQLDKAKASYKTAHKRLSSGAGNLVKKTEDLRKLGVVARKKLPEALVEKAEN
jgi:DNA recombination protein RmuC